jgi:hypothetical protein
MYRVIRVYLAAIMAFGPAKDACAALGKHSSKKHPSHRQNLEKRLSPARLDGARGAFGSYDIGMRPEPWPARKPPIKAVPPGERPTPPITPEPAVPRQGAEPAAPLRWPIVFARPTAPPTAATPDQVVERWTGFQFGAIVDGGSPGPFGRPGLEVGIYKSVNDFAFGLEATVQGPGLGRSQPFNYRWNGSITAIVGYSVGGVLPYLGIGSAVTEVSMQTPFASDSFSRTGWLVSGGLKLPIAENFVGNIEFRHQDFGTVQSPLGDIRATTNELRLGLMYRLAPSDVVRAWH